MIFLYFHKTFLHKHVYVIPCRIYGSNWDCLQKQQLFKHQVSWEYKNCVFRRADCNDLCKFSCFCVFVLFECKWRHQLKKLNRERGKQLSLLKINLAVIIFVACGAPHFSFPFHWMRPMFYVITLQMEKCTETMAITKLNTFEMSIVFLYKINHGTLL